MASARLGAPVEKLTVAHGAVSVADNSARQVTYGQLIGDRRVEVPYTGKAPIKDYRTHKIVGTSVPRIDIPDKAQGVYVYMQHVRVPGMLHGRVVRPRGQGSYADGARVMNVDAASIRDVPGARVIRRGDFVGVVAAKEWDAVRAARQLRGRPPSCSRRCAPPGPSTGWCSIAETSPPRSRVPLMSHRAGLTRPTRPTLPLLRAAPSLTSRPTPPW